MTDMEACLTRRKPVGLEVPIEQPLTGRQLPLRPFHGDPDTRIVAGEESEEGDELWWTR